MDSSDSPLLKLPLDGLHRSLGAKFAPFSGYDMPVQYEGLIAEHNWTRTNAGLFDVSHMGPCFLTLNEGVGVGDEAHKRIAAIVEKLVPADIQGLKPGQIRYTVLLNDSGGVLDDLMIARPLAPMRQGALYIVVNAGMKTQDFRLLAHASGSEAKLERADDQILLALQGPKAVVVAARLAPDLAQLSFMHTWRGQILGENCVVARSGYTGEDGYELLVPPAIAEKVAQFLLDQPEVRPIGLGARDTLRLEAGLCLYGHELGETISPIEADLAWTIQKRRRAAGDFPGAKRILSELSAGPKIKRVGIRPADRAPARDNTEIQVNGHKIGVVTSGGFSPTLNAPISMGYVEAPYAAPGTRIDLIVRGQARVAEIVPLPFVPHRYFKGI
ncbi:MAG TPA: glycine cleavage system aminomethyltransferase GcvT [Caulobacterales bacterium]|nr:glycine cleavage system aminomethyltransferase GcvT [Caulobacterales bacterium]